MRFSTATALVGAVALAGAGVAFANGSFKGNTAPDINAMEFVQGTPVDGGLRAYRGKVVCLEFFGTG